MSHSDDQKFRQPEGLDVHEADDGLIVFNADTDKVHHLNSTAGVLFLLCEQPTAYASLVQQFKELFEDADKDLQAIDDVLTQMTKDGVLLKVSE